MKKVWLLVCCLVLVAVAGLAQAPTHAPVTLADIYATAPAALPSAPMDGTVLAAKSPTGKVICAAAANCWNGTTVNCSSSTVGDTCAAVDSSCTAQQGYVRCGTTYTYCPSCLICTEGQTRTVATGWCCDEGTKERAIQTCISNHWVTTDYQCGPLLCKPIQQ
jgi:hypothetical protein